MFRKHRIAVIFLIVAAAALCECTEYKPTDVIFVVDGSGSVGRTNFKRMKDWLASVTKDLMEKMGDAVQIGIITYSTNYAAPIRLGDCATPSCMEKMISKIDYEGKSTFTTNALAFALESEYPHSERYGRAEKVLIHITDGMARFRKRLPLWFSVADDMGVTIVSIGVGKGVRLEQLKIVANGGKSMERVFLSKDFSSLPEISDSITAVVYENNRKTAESAPCDPIDIMFVVDGSASILEANFEQVREWLVTTCSDIHDRFGNQAQSGVFEFSHYFDDKDYSEQIVEIPFRIGDCATTECMKTTIGAMAHLNSTTYTYHALQRVIDIEFPYSTRAKFSKKVVILITDGRAFDGELLPGWYDESVTHDITSYAIGVGNYTLQQLRVVANGGKSDDNVFTTNDYGHLPTMIPQDIATKFGSCPDYK